jgi:hypothetical protein
MMSRKSENSKIYTQYVPLRQNVEEKGRGKGLKEVCIEILMSETFAKINPTDPLRLAKKSAQRNRN